MKLTLDKLVTDIIGKLAGYFITLVAAASVLVFIWGITKYIFRGDSEAERDKGKKIMIWGIIGFVVMFGVWGILAIMGETIGINAVVPQFKTTNTAPSSAPSAPAPKPSLPMGAS